MTPLQAFMISAEGNVAFAFSWSTQALVLPRLAKTERGGYWGTTLAYGVVAPFFVAAGGVMALAMFVRTGVYESDPTNMLSYLCGSGFRAAEPAAGRVCECRHAGYRLLCQLHDRQERHAQGQL